MPLSPITLFESSLRPAPHKSPLAEVFAQVVVVVEQLEHTYISGLSKSLWGSNIVQWMQQTEVAPLAV